MLQAVLGVTPLLCGILMLPYSLGGALASVPIALFNDYVSKRTKSTSCYKQAIVAGLALSTLGFGVCFCYENCSMSDNYFQGLLTLLDETSRLVTRELYPMVAGIGIGMLFHAPFPALTNGMSSHERSRTTSAFFLVRFIGATSGLVSFSLSQTAFTLIVVPLVHSWRHIREQDLADYVAKCHARPLRFINRLAPAGAH
jgi:hypothetical protein